MTESADRRGGQLVLVATPIGNLGDLTPRALAYLQSADVVFCEDTRRTRTLYAAHGLKVGRLVSLHEHNEASQIGEIIERITRGEVVAVVSDAGTPGISDPGSRVVAAVVRAGLSVTTAPGPSAVIAALGVSGLPTDRFVMEGFLPRKGADRAAVLATWVQEERTIVFYESPKRLAATLAELAERWPNRAAAVVRELTKVHEEVRRGDLRELAEWSARTAVQGEVTVVVGGAAPAAPVSAALIAEAVARALADGASVRDAAAFVSTSLGVAHRVVYEIALQQRSAP
jgi:16S rRNA (cytidine1402-2'-O)-methyltransferase